MEWTSEKKNINFLITPRCLWLPVVLGWSCSVVKLHFCNLFFCVGTIWKNYVTYLSYIVSSLHAALLILFMALSVSGIGCLQRGNSRLPFLPGSIASATIKMTIYTSSVVHFWTTEANHYTVYMYMYINMNSLAWSVKLYWQSGN